MGVDIDNFILPGEGTAEKLKKIGITSKNLSENGLSGIEMMQFGHDKGVAYEFFTIKIKNAKKTKAVGFSVPDTIEMIRWFTDKYNKVPEQVRFLPPELLEFDRNDDGSLGECIGGSYKATYDAWKNGTNAPGMRLDKWADVDDDMVFTLNDMRCYTVEQLAELPKSKLDRLPKEFLEAQKSAKDYVAGKSQRDKTDELVNKLTSVTLEREKDRARMLEMEQQIQQLLGGKAPKAVVKKAPAKTGKAKAVKAVKANPDAPKVVNGEIV